MAGTSFQVTRTGDRQLDAIQQAVADTLAQLEDLRRGMLVATVFTSTADAQLAEHLIAIYVGPGGNRFTLPPAALRGPMRGQILAVSNTSTGNLTVAASGSEKVNGAATITLATGASAMLFSDGVSAWRAVT